MGWLGNKKVTFDERGTDPRGSRATQVVLPVVVLVLLAAGATVMSFGGSTAAPRSPQEPLLGHDAASGSSPLSAEGDGEAASPAARLGAGDSQSGGGSDSSLYLAELLSLGSGSGPDDEPTRYSGSEAGSPARGADTALQVEAALKADPAPTTTATTSVFESEAWIELYGCCAPHDLKPAPGIDEDYFTTSVPQQPQFIDVFAVDLDAITVSVPTTSATVPPSPTVAPTTTAAPTTAAPTTTVAPTTTAAPTTAAPTTTVAPTTTAAPATTTAPTTTTASTTTAPTTAATSGAGADPG